MHRRLVQQLVSAARNRLGDNSLIFVDGEDDYSAGCPPRLDASRPDLYARAFGERRHVIIGEAKTESDIDSPHTASQLSAYFIHLRDEAPGELLVPVPYLAAGAAYRVCWTARRRAGCDQVPFEVSGWFFGNVNFSRAWRG